MIIQLTEIEMRICKWVSTIRIGINKKNNIKNAKRGSQSDDYTIFQGYCAEVAFCKLYNIYPDFTVHSRSAIKGTDHGDARLPNGKTVDIKATKYQNGKLLAVPWKKPSGDYFALMVGEAPTFELKGFMAQHELIKKERLGNLGCGKVYIAEQHELTFNI